MLCDCEVRKSKISVAIIVLACYVQNIQILEEIEANEIKIYSFPGCGEDEEEMELNQQMKVHETFMSYGHFFLITIRPLYLQRTSLAWPAGVDAWPFCLFVNLLAGSHSICSGWQ